MQRTRPIRHERVYRRDAIEGSDCQLYPFDPLCSAIPAKQDLLASSDRLPLPNADFLNALRNLQGTRLGTVQTQTGPTQSDTAFINS